MVTRPPRKSLRKSSFKALSRLTTKLRYFAEARFNLAVLAEWQGDYECAMEIMKQLLIQKPELETLSGSM